MISVLAHSAIAGAVGERAAMQRVDRIMDGLLLGLVMVAPIYMVIKISRHLLL